eukprot:6195973-Pleurochrysis_carterae.AAC.1
MNNVLKNYGRNWRFAKHAKIGDQRPHGNYARSLLTRHGLIADLHTKVYGEVKSTETVSALESMQPCVAAKFEPLQHRRH